MRRSGPILIVDDSPFDTELILEAFRRSELPNEIHTTRDGVEALDYLYRRAAFSGRINENPILILLDLKMPRLNGLEVLERIKSDPHLSALPVVMLTGSRQASDFDESYRLGANAFVVKPTDFGELAKAIQKTGAFWAAWNKSLARAVLPSP